MKIEDANKLALERLELSEPILIDLKQAIDVVPDMKSNRIHHAGPPIDWEEMSGPMRGSIIGTAILEGLVKSEEEADEAIKNGDIELGSNHDHGTVGPMAGPVGATTPVFVVKNNHHGNLAYSPVHEGLGKVLSMGNYSENVLDNLRFVRDVLQPIISKVLNRMGGIPLNPLMSEAIVRGDELHNRCKAGTCMFVEQMVPHLLHVTNKEEFVEVFEFLTTNPQTFLQPVMAACKATLDSASGIEGSTLLTCYSRNGSTVGLRMSGTGNKWFIAKAPMIKGLYMPGYSEEDACPDLGDSAITEVAGLGAMVMAGSPAMTLLVGGSASQAASYTMDMYDITMTESKIIRLPSLDFRGAPLGVDVRKVVETGISTKHNTAIAHREPGIGMIGAGIVEAPMEVFTEALLELSKKLEK
ncbi:MAG: DUF1116 domain-containing protein [Firmicutes bacterium]|nr:DUF1116 domain-containing protein [Bacillota bacterium]